MKTWLVTAILILANVLSALPAQAKSVPDVFTLGRDLCLATARTQLLDSCDFHAELKTRKSSMWGMALEICSTYGESNPARESHCYTRAAVLIKDEDTKAESAKCTGLSSAGEKSSCLKKVFSAREVASKSLIN